jgi:hypothetical protein
MFNRFSKDDGKKLVDAEKGITNLHLAAYRKNIEMMGLFSIDFLLDKEPLTMTRKNKITQVVDKFGNTEYDYFRSK